MGFNAERELIERALAHDDSIDEGDAEFPPVARRFAEAREARRLTIEEVAAQWGQPPSMYWDLEFHDDEAFSTVSVRELVNLGEILHVSVMQLLFGEDPSAVFPLVTFSEVVRRLHSVMRDRAISADGLGERDGMSQSFSRVRTSSPTYQYSACEGSVKWQASIGRPCWPTLRNVSDDAGGRADLATRGIARKLPRAHPLELAGLGAGAGVVLGVALFGHPPVVYRGSRRLLSGASR